MHDVDEEMRTITHHGGDWNHAADAGIAGRFVDHATTYSGDWVASVKNKRLAAHYGLLVSYTYFRLMNVSWIQQISCNQTIHL